MHKAQAWLNMLRVSNTPTIISNVMVGLGLGMVAHTQEWSTHAIAPRFVALKAFCIILAALLCAYFGGLVLNDAVDASRDKKHRPERPIPIGVIKLRTAWIVGVSLLLGAYLLSLLTQDRAALGMLVLIGCVFLYTFLHRWLLPALLFMGACRGMVYVVTAASFDVVLQGQPLIAFAIGVACYTAILTLIAHHEHVKNKMVKWVALLLLPTAFIPALLYSTAFTMIWVVGSLLVFTIWIAFAFWQFASQESRGKGIHATLAGFCFLDCVYLSIIGEISLAIISGICFLFTVAAQRKVLGT